MVELNPPEGTLAYAMRVKLTDEILSKIASGAQLSIKLSGKENVLYVDEMQHDLIVSAEPSKTHNALYEEQEDESFTKIGEVMSKVSVKRVLNKRVEEHVKSMNTEAENAYRGRKTTFASEKQLRNIPKTSSSTTTTQKQLGHKRQRPPSRKLGGSATISRKIGVAPPTATLSRKVDVAASALAPAAPAAAKKRRLAEIVKKGPAKAGRAKSGKSHTKTPPKAKGAEAQESKRNAPVAKERTRANKLKPALGKLQVSIPAQNTTMESKPFNGAISTPQPVLLAKSQACPHTPLTSEINPSQFTSYQEITTYPQYKQYAEEFRQKHERYKKLDQDLTENSQMFERLGQELQQCKDKAKSSKLKKEIKALYEDKKRPVKEMVKRYKVLHLELKSIKKAVAEYIPVYKKQKQHRLEQLAAMNPVPDEAAYR